MDNIILITAGGVGERFGSDVPKQYCLLNNKPVISYVIKACKKCNLVDEIVVAANEQYHSLLKSEYNIDVCQSGKNLNETKRNGFDYIESHYQCSKIIIVDAVRPTITSDVLDKFFMVLDDYDAVACARKITDSLIEVGKWGTDRSNYFTVSAPEGFVFPLINSCFKSFCPNFESIFQLPETSNIFFDFDVPYFDKITYPDDIARIESIIKNMSPSSITAL